MNSRNQNRKVSPSKSKSRGFLLWLGRIVGVIIALMIVGAIYESVAEAADAKAYPPPGQMVDVGGYRLHINCTGTGSPTVVIDAGLGDWSTGWGFVQPEIAKATRVCTYDRAGWAWSEPGPLPRERRRPSGRLPLRLHHALGRCPGREDPEWRVPVVARCRIPRHDG